MKNKTPQLLMIFMVSLFIIPQITFAAWWNPVSWKIFNKKSETKTKQIIIATTTPNSTADLGKAISSKTKSFADTSEKKINTSSEQSSAKSAPKPKNVVNLNTEKSSNSTDKKQESLSPKTTGGGSLINGVTSGARPVTPVNCSEYKNLFDSIPNCAIYSDASSGIDTPLYKICKQCFPLDISQPLISSIQAINITENSATITWDTSEPSDSKVFYSTYSSSTDTYASPFMNIFDSTYTLSHKLNLNNLNSGTNYYYEVHSKRTSGTSALRTRQFFTTP